MFGNFQGIWWKTFFTSFRRQLNLTLDLTFSNVSPKKI